MKQNSILFSNVGGSMIYNIHVYLINGRILTVNEFEIKKGTNSANVFKNALDALIFCNQGCHIIITTSLKFGLHS